MSDEVAPVVDAPVSPTTRKEHWKVRAKRLREEAMARGEPDPAEVKVTFAGLEPAPSNNGVPAASKGPATGFLSWDDFCNAVAIDLVTSQFGFQLLTNYTGDESAQVFYSRMRLAYDSMKKAHATGVAQGV